MLYTNEKLANAYVLKENFYTFIASPDYETSKKHLQSWVHSALSSDLPRFYSCVKIMLNWQEGILNTFTTAIQKVSTTNLKYLKEMPLAIIIFLGLEIEFFIRQTKNRQYNF